MDDHKKEWKEAKEDLIMEKSVNYILTGKRRIKMTLSNENTSFASFVSILSPLGKKNYGVCLYLNKGQRIDIGDKACIYPDYIKTKNIKNNHVPIILRYVGDGRYMQQSIDIEGMIDIMTPKEFQCPLYKSDNCKCHLRIDDKDNHGA